MKKTYATFTLALFGLGINAQTWQWARSAGKIDEAGNKIAVDASGNSYVIGNFRSASITFGTITLTNHSNVNVF